jgi:integrase
MDGLAAQALLLTILTAGRSGEILTARWSEINLAACRTEFTN